MKKFTILCNRCQSEDVHVDSIMSYGECEGHVIICNSCGLNHNSYDPNEELDKKRRTIIDDKIPIEHIKDYIIPANSGVRYYDKDKNYLGTSGEDEKIASFVAVTIPISEEEKL